MAHSSQKLDYPTIQVGLSYYSVTNSIKPTQKLVFIIENSLFLPYEKHLRSLVFQSGEASVISIEQRISLNLMT